jgi:hypothetical protein
MNLEDQLRELRVNILRDRSDIISGDTDSLWSDETLLRYIGDAERRFARRTLILRDGDTPEVTRIPLRTGVVTYPLHKAVLAVLSAKLAGTTLDILRSGHAIVAQSHPAEFLTFDPTMTYTVPPSAPVAFYTDETMVFARQSRVSLSVYPAPSATENGVVLNIRTIRLPVSGYTESELLAESEIPEDYQLDVLEWAAYRALRSFDADAGAPTSADAHKAAFEETVRQAIQELKRKMFANTGLRYGSNGFTWVR